MDLEVMEAMGITDMADTDVGTEGTVTVDTDVATVVTAAVDTDVATVVTAAVDTAVMEIVEVMATTRQDSLPNFVTCIIPLYINTSFLIIT